MEIEILFHSLKKEREQMESEKTNNTSKESTKTVLPKELIEPVQNAVPGTQLPGQRNWVVGKFGRALPVVHIRPKHGRKIIKFDPSKTMHNLKRIKEEEESISKNVSELTWNLESRGWWDPWDRNKAKDTESAIGISSSNESGEEDVKTNHKSKKKAKISKKNENINERIDMPSIESCECYSQNSALQNETDFNGNLKKKHKIKDIVKKNTLVYDYNLDKIQSEKAKAENKSPTIDESDSSTSCFQYTEHNLLNTKKKHKGTKKDQNAEGQKDQIAIDSKNDKAVSSSTSFQFGKGIDKKVKRKSESKRLRGEDVEQDNSFMNELSRTIKKDSENSIGKATDKRKKKRKNENILNEEDDTSFDKYNKITILHNDVTIDDEKRGKTEKKKSHHKTSSSEEKYLIAEGSDHVLEKNDEDTSADDKRLIGKKGMRKHEGKSEESFREEIDVNEVHFTSEENASNGFEDCVIAERDNKPSKHRHNKKRISKETKSDNSNLLNDQGNEMVMSDTGKELSTIIILKENVNKKNLSSNKITNSMKKETSNEKRLKAIKERKLNTITKQSIISTALQNLDNDKPKNLKYIKFDDNNDSDGLIDKEEGKAVKYQTKKQIPGKVSGAKAANWLGLDSDSDDNSNEAIFDAKPQFEGKTGQKVFQLQKSYRGDSRFQLDKRFIDSDDNDDTDDISITASPKHDIDDINIVEDDDDDELTKQLSKEKNMEMSVLQGILGENFGNKYRGSTQKHTFKNTNLLRYDPTRDDHAQYEQAQKNYSSDEPAIKERQSSKGDDMRNNVPEVSVDKYYDVKTDALTEMFSGKTKDCAPSTFTFLSSQDEDDEPSCPVDWGQAEELKSKPSNPVMLPYDSSGDEQEHDDIQGESQIEDHSLPDERFFFHFGDSELESSVYDQEDAFMRTATLEELNEHWVKVRSELTQDYKKKHKDARRRHRKMAAKRARTR